MKYGLILILFTVIAPACAQWTPSVSSFDTVMIDHRTGGKLDSLDLLFRSLQTSPVNNSDFTNGIIPVNFLIKNQNGLFAASSDWGTDVMRYCGLPHIGFAYGFGAAGIQTAKLQYEQVFAKKLLVNLDYLNDRANGLMRNSAHRFSDARLSIINRSSRYTFKFVGEDRLLERGLNGGLQEPYNVVDFPLIFQPIRKLDASEKVRLSHLKLNNYFDFLKSDSIRSMGISSEHSLHVQRRIFSENGNLVDHYSEIYIDTFSTRDSYQLSSTSHEAGLYYKSSNLFATFLASGRYWKYYNQTNQLDTTEFGLHDKIHFGKGKLKISHEGRLNLIGAGREWESRLVGEFANHKIEWTGILDLESKWPVVFLRSYHANNFMYDLPVYERQFRSSLSNSLSVLLGRFPVKLFHESVLLKDNYFWNGSNWQNDLFPNISFHSISLGSEFNFKSLNFHPKYTFTISDSPVKFRPDHIAQSRIFLKGGLFKGKKPLAYIGADVIWQSEFGVLDLVPAMGTYVMNTALPLQKSYLNVHGFAGFQIDEFRFYVRFENIGYFWNDREIQIVNGYTIPSGILRLGLTWDFFN